MSSQGLNPIFTTVAVPSVEPRFVGTQVFKDRYDYIAYLLSIHVNEQHAFTPKQRTEINAHLELTREHHNENDRFEALQQLKTIAGERYIKYDAASNTDISSLATSVIYRMLEKKICDLLVAASGAETFNKNTQVIYYLNGLKQGWFVRFDETFLNSVVIKTTEKKEIPLDLEQVKRI